MNPDTVKKNSKKLSWLLRHGAIESKLPMDAAGWSAIADVLRVARMKRYVLDAVVEQNDKQRLQVDGDRIRASQGHSLDGTPVTLDGLERSWHEWYGTETVWHGTVVDAALSIAQTGIQARARSHVHLAESTRSKVGKRWNTPVLLGIDPERVRVSGVGIYRSPNGVLLCRHVPSDAVVALELRSKKAEAARDELELAFIDSLQAI